MVYGIWYMVYGIWYMIYSIWYMVYMVYGIRYIVYDYVLDSMVLLGIAWYCMVLHMLSEVYVSFVIFGIVIFCMHEVVSNIHFISMHIIIKYSTAQYCMVSIVLQIVHTNISCISHYVKLWGLPRRVFTLLLSLFLLSLFLLSLFFCGCNFCPASSCCTLLQSTQSGLHVSFFY